MPEIVKAQPSALEIIDRLSRNVTDAQVAMEIAKQAVELEIRHETLRQSRDRFEWEKLDREARVAFAAAFQKFKEDAPKILKTKHVSFSIKTGGQTNYWHVELDKACDLLIPALLKVDITHRWKSTDLPGGSVRVTCYLRHRLGHEEEGASLAGPADQSGGKNPIQGVGSSTSYLERYTFLATCGIVPTGVDNDGNPPGMTQEEADSYINAMREAQTPGEVMAEWTKGINACKKLEPIDYRAMTILTEARDQALLEIKRKK